MERCGRRRYWRESLRTHKDNSCRDSETRRDNQKNLCVSVSQWQIKEMNENENLGRVISLIYRLGFHISGNPFCGGDHPTIPSCISALSDLRCDPVCLAARVRRSCTNCRELEIHRDRRDCPAVRRQWTGCLG